SQAAIDFGSEERAENAGGEDAGFARDVVDCLNRLESYFGEVRADFRQSSEGNPFPVRLDRPFFDDLGDRLHDLLRRYLLNPKRRAVPRGEDEFLEMARGLEEFHTVLEIEGEEFVHLYDETGKSDQLRILCLNPALQLRKRHRAFHSVVAMSATLSPLEFYRDVLGFEPDARLLSLPSPFPPDNRKVVVVPEVSTRYRHRAAAAPRIGRIIERVVAVRPGNYLAFFPSFEFLGAVRPFLRPEGYRLLVQKRTMGDHSRNALLEELASGGEPHLLLGVQGGIFAEGVDYPGDLAIGVIIVGPALPRVGRELDLTRQYFEEQYGRGFEYACLFPGMNRVVQSAGRVIRSETDRGVIVLVGQRFGYQNYMSLFPGYWYESSPIELVSTALEAELVRFWGERPPAAGPDPVPPPSFDSGGRIE
ncbi:MAG: ATP-dependent DNA helicase, partial [Acidobacteria bacterium]|nr:ATP-dependent DNA helicase [Acidobacteriota bacterium]